MAWKPIPHLEWQERATADFWEPFGRKRSNDVRLKMVKKQFEELHILDLPAAHEFASRLAFDNEGVPLIRAYGFQFLAQMAETAGDIDSAIDHALCCCKLQAMGNRRDVDILAPNGPELLVDLVCGHGRNERAAKAAEAIRQVPPTIVHNSDLERQLQTAVCLSLAGQAEEAARLANNALNERFKRSGNTGVGSLTYASKSRAMNRELFSLARRGGRARIAGLLGADSPFSPKQLNAKIAVNVYFKQAAIEHLPNRLIVDLAEFSLDLRWSADAELIEQVRGLYDSFKDEDRQLIPRPPADPKYALLVLAIGDDTSLPAVINPMIDLASILEGFGKCLFYDKIGPLSTAGR